MTVSDLHFSDSQKFSILPQAQSFSEEDSTRGSKLLKQPDRIAQVVAHSDIKRKRLAIQIRERGSMSHENTAVVVATEISGA